MRIQASLEFLLIVGAVALLSLSVISLYSKNVFSQDSALAKFANISFNVSNFSSIAPPVYQPAPQPQAYSISISNRSERLLYKLSGPDSILTVHQFNHMVYCGFFGHPFGTAAQCYTPSSWDYLMGSCFSGKAYCVVPQNTTYAVQNTSSNRSYAYSFLLSIGTQSGVLTSRISNNTSSSAVMLANKTIGHASVHGVVSSEPYRSAYLLSHAGSYSALNYTAYQRYVQAKNQLYATLSYYNSTWVDSPTQTSIEQMVSAFNASSSSIANSSSGKAGCSISNSSYSCAAGYPFFYVINVTLDASFQKTNQTLYYLGSEVRVS